ncbi:ATP synthase protein I [Rhodoferax antarcticus]|nr:ATP synthase protein I [Rhodoferax antarcticus]
MATIPPTEWRDSDCEDAQEPPVPLTPEQIAAVKAANPVSTPWWVVAGQAGVGCVVVGLAWLLFGGVIARSVLCGVLAVVLPAALFVRSLTSKFSKSSPGSAVISFFVWELVKILVTLGMLFAAHRWVTDLSWPAMLAGLAITLKVYWLALAFKRRRQLVRLS